MPSGIVQYSFKTAASEPSQCQCPPQMMPPTMLTYTPLLFEIVFLLILLLIPIVIIISLLDTLKGSRCQKS